MIAPLAVNFSKWLSTVPLLCDSIVIGWTAATLKEKFDAELAKYRDPVVYWYDHSSFDASQTAALRSVISRHFMRRFLDKFFAAFGQPSAYHSPLRKYLTDFVVKVFYSAPI
jgi:hypothetical protein